MSELSKQTCKACEGIGKSLTSNESKNYLRQVSGWTLSTDSKLIQKELKVKDFLEAVEFINHVSKIAESENHHPDIHLTGYRNLKIELTTHALKGLTENDFIVAAKIDEIPVELKPNV